MTDVRLRAPMRRLVVTGKDTPDNIVKFFGRNGKEQVEALQNEARFNVLLSPPQGSPSWAMSKRMNFDLNCPP